MPSVPISEGETPKPSKLGNAVEVMRNLGMNFGGVLMSSDSRYHGFLDDGNWEMQWSEAGLGFSLKFSMVLV